MKVMKLSARLMSLLPKRLRTVDWRERLTFLVTILLIVVLMVGMTYVLVEGEKDSTIEKVKFENTVAATRVSERLANLFRSSDAVMMHSVKDMEADGLAEIGHVLGDAKDLIASFPEIGFFLIVDRDGNLLGSTPSSASQPVSLADRPYFKAHQAGADLIVGRPMVGRVSGKTVLPVSRRLHDKNGAFAGVSIIGIEVAVIDDILRGGVADGGSSSSLLSPDGEILARYPPLPENMSVPAIHVARLFGGSSMGSFVGRSPVDGLERVFAYATLPSYQLVAVVGTDTAAVLVHWRQRLLALTLFDVVVIALLTGFGLRDLRLRAEVRRNRDRFAAIAEASSDWFWEMDRDLRFRWFSDRFSAITSVNLTSIIGKRRQDLILAISPDSLAKHLDDLAAHRPFKNFEYPIKTPGGRKFLRISGMPIFDGNGEFDGYRGTGSDVTRLKETELRIRGVLDTTAEGIIGINDKGRVIFANQAAAEILGWPDPEAMQGGTSAEVIGHHLADGHSCSDGRCPILATLRNGEVCRVADESQGNRFRLTAAGSE